MHLLSALTGSEKGLWGKMNAWQMVEHLIAFFDISNNKLSFPLVTSPEDVDKYKSFIYSNKEFRENTKAPLSVVPDEPLPVRSDSFPAALNNLKEAIENFFNYFHKNPSAQIIHPVFGLLAGNELILLHGKHVRHHLRQFNLY